MRGVGIVLAVGLLAFSSCGSPTATQTAERFRAAQSIRIVALPSGTHIATISKAEDLAALADAVALGHYGRPCKCQPALRLVIIHPDATKGNAYVDIHRTGGAIHRGWVDYDGIGPVVPSTLFWEVLERYVKV